MRWYLIRFDTYRDGIFYPDLVRAYFMAPDDEHAKVEFWRYWRRLFRYQLNNPGRDYDIPREITSLDNQNHVLI